MQYSPAGPVRGKTMAAGSSTSPTGSGSTLTPVTAGSITTLPAAGSAAAVTSSGARETGFSTGHRALTPGPTINANTHRKTNQLAINPGFSNHEYIVFTGRQNTAAPTQRTPLSAIPPHMSSTSSHPMTPTSTSSEPIVHSSGLISAHRPALAGNQSATSSLPDHKGSFSPDHKDSFSPEKYNKSVKHLTCFYWHRYGKCTKSEDECLYAHYLTGQLADEPRHVEPGRPAVAGRNARAKIPVLQNWRGAPTTGNSTAPNSMNYGTSTNEHASPFSYNQIHGSSAAHDSPLRYSSGVASNVQPPPSTLTQRFINMTMNHPGTTTQDFQERRMRTLEGIVDLQVYLAKASQESFATISEAIKYCRAELSISASSLHGSPGNAQQHLKVVDVLVNKCLEVESEAEAMAERIQMMTLEVNGELAKAGFPTIPL